MSPRGNSKPKKAVGMTWAQAFRDITVGSMNKGQLPLLGIIAIILVILWRMPPERLSELAFNIIGMLERGDLFGWLLFVLVLASWWTNSKAMRKWYATELDRVGREKSDLQRQLANRHLPGSRQPRR